MKLEELWLAEKPLAVTFRLQHLLKLDSWHFQSALWILMGLDERTIQFVQVRDEGDYPSDTDEVLSIRALDGRKFESHQSFEIDDLDDLCALHETLIEIWLSGSHLPDNPPDYYLLWASSKGFSIPWHKWAYENGLTLVPVPGDEQGKAVAKSDGTATVYMTPLLEIANAAIANFFSPRRVPDAKKPEVVEWIKTKMKDAEMVGSDNIATAIFTIIKPVDHDPRKRRG